MTFVIVYLILGAVEVVACIAHGSVLTDGFKNLYSMKNLLIAAGIIGICSRLDKKAKEGKTDERN